MSTYLLIILLQTTESIVKIASTALKVDRWLVTQSSISVYEIFYFQI